MTGKRKARDGFTYVLDSIQARKPAAAVGAVKVLLNLVLPALVLGVKGGVAESTGPLLVFKAVAVFGPIARIGAAIVTANTVALDVHVSRARLLIEEELRARVAFELWSTMPSREAVVFPCAPACGKLLAARPAFVHGVREHCGLKCNGIW
jgi:hypothetical protein